MLMLQFPFLKEKSRSVVYYTSIEYISLFLHFKKEKIMAATYLQGF